MVDARNAFNELNRRAALINIRTISPALSRVLTNFYRQPAKLFVGGETLLSEEGTTQGDPLAMGMYALATVPLINNLRKKSNQFWFADDATGSGKIDGLWNWWTTLKEIGPAYGYFPQAHKTWLLVKETAVEKARLRFGSTGVNITTDGRRLLGAALGTHSFVNDFLERKVHVWTQELLTLSRIAVSQPHAAYSAFTHGLMGKWVFTARCSEGAASYFEPLETVIRNSFIPALTGRNAPSDEERALLALPVRHGGLGLSNPMKMFVTEHERSIVNTESLRDLICAQSETLGGACAVVRARCRVATILKRKVAKEAADKLREMLSTESQRALEVATDCGASHWLSVLPLESHGFALHKSAFRDALCLRYCWQPPNLPNRCACGQDFSVNHALTCPTGGFPSLRHNEICDLTAGLLREVCHDVQTEPYLQPLSGETLAGRTANTAPEARLDVSAAGLWGDRFSRAFFDVRVFHPFARSYRSSSLSAVFNRHEQEKRRQYQQRVLDVEMSTFTPLVFSTAGGMGRAAKATIQRLASLLADKYKTPYTTTINWLRCRYAFSLLRASIMCLRGARNNKAFRMAVPLLAAAECHIPEED